MPERASLTIREYYSQTIHRPHLEATLRGLVGCYRRANLLLDAECPGLEGREAKPHLKRAMVDRMLLFEAQKFPQHATAKLAENKSGNSRHAEVYVGNLTITAHYIPTPDGIARPAVYRHSLSDHPDQLNLFGSPTVQPNAKLYGHILHGCSGCDEGKDRDQPDFVWLKFPRPGCVEYSAEYIDLIAEFPHVFGRVRSSQPSEEVVDAAEPTIRPQEGTGDAG